MPSVAMNSSFEELALSYPDAMFLTVDVDEVKVNHSIFENYAFEPRSHFVILFENKWSVLLMLKC